jgi:hypothetical protein
LIKSKAHSLKNFFIYFKNKPCAFPSLGHNVSSMSNTDIVNEILGETSVSPSDYPKVEWTSVDGNAFSIIGTASKAWRSKDREVANRIGSVLMAKATSYDALLSACLQICPMGSDDEDEG